jgi:hypothetical protein
MGLGLAPVYVRPCSLVALIVMHVLQEFGAVFLLFVPGQWRPSMGA